MKKNNSKKMWRILLGLAIILLVYCYVQNNWIQVERLECKLDIPKEMNGIRIVQISDVHLPKNGASIDTLINKVQDLNPDIIVMTGDIIDKECEINESELEKLCSGLSEVAKVYSVTGNHEKWNGGEKRWVEIMKANKVAVLKNETAEFSRGEKSISIVGIDDGMLFSRESITEIEGFEKAVKEGYILLLHKPENFINDGLSKVEEPRIIFSGHAHGGQFRIPFTNKGVIAPGQGIMPKYTSGVYKIDNSFMIVSRGLGNSIIPVRINNRPHLPVVTLRKID